MGSLDFKTDGTFTYTFLDEIKKRIKRYSFDASTCEIILGTKRKEISKRKAWQRSNLEILYLDNKVLIFKEDNNPKSYTTHLLVKV
jgi:hypothetical protein